MVTEAREVEAKNSPSLMIFTEVGMMMDLRELHEEKAPIPILVTVVGIKMDVVGIKMDVMFEHPANALFSMIETLLGIVMTV